MDECGENLPHIAGGIPDPMYGLHLCDVNAVCANGIGNYSCTCNVSMRLSNALSSHPYIFML